MALSCLIVDDERLAQDILEGYIEKTPHLRLSGSCNNALEAISALHAESIDLMFLDIKMPEITGGDLIKLLKNPPAIILTTAFSEYALEGYEWNITDYLLKPIAYERFLKAVQKVQYSFREKEALQQDFNEVTIFVKSDGNLVKVNPAELVYIEGLKNYLVLHYQLQKIIVHSTFLKMEDALRPYGCFMRIHKSYLVNKTFISHITGNLLNLSGGQQLPIGPSFKNDLMQSINVIG
jgi:DNA-binding LytR/AlgR family response regulator